MGCSSTDTAPIVSSSTPARRRIRWKHPSRGRSALRRLFRLRWHDHRNHPRPGGRVAEVSLGSASASNQVFLFTALDGAHVLSADIKGVLGEQFLAHFDYLLDFAKHRLVFGGPPPDGGNRVGFETIHGCPAIETSEGRLMLDSGANAAFLYRSSPPSADGTVIRTASGTASVSTIQGLRLEIAGRGYHPANAASVRRPLLGRWLAAGQPVPCRLY